MPIPLHILVTRITELGIVFNRQFKNKEEVAALATSWLEAFSDLSLIAPNSTPMSKSDFEATCKFYIQTGHQFPCPADILDTLMRWRSAMRKKIARISASENNHELPSSVSNLAIKD